MHKWKFTSLPVASHKDTETATVTMVTEPGSSSMQCVSVVCCLSKELQVRAQFDTFIPKGNIFIDLLINVDTSFSESRLIVDANFLRCELNE